MGKSSKRRKELAALAKKEKRARTSRALETLAKYQISTRDLQSWDKNLVRERKHGSKQEPSKREGEAVGAGGPDCDRNGANGGPSVAPRERNGDVCGIEDLFVPGATVGGGRTAGGVGGDEPRKGKPGKATPASRPSRGEEDRRQTVNKSAGTSSKPAAVDKAREDDGGAETDPQPERRVPRAPTLEEELRKKAESVRSGDYVVHVTRKEDIENSRTALPICAMEQEIMEAVNYNATVLICGETGSGKTTQIPQFLYEAGYGTKRTKGQVGITQPRRIAASSTAERVAQELDTKLGDIVGYQVRHNKRMGSRTALKFMTDGILMRELQEDALLRKYSVIVLDEVHERNMNTDVILGFLTRIIPLRAKLASNPGSGIEELKLLIMSATLSSKEFVENRRLFREPPPVISIPVKRFPVTIHFSRKTEMHSYLDVAYKKVVAIHRKLPNGGILVFVTGQREVMYLTKRLQKRLGRGAELPAPAQSGQDEEEDEEEGGDLNPFDGDAAEDFSSDEEDSDLDEEEADRSDDDESEEEDREELPGTIAGKGDEEEGRGKDVRLDAIVVPLYAKLGREAQGRAFMKPPANSRLIIIATNVAETSITIPGIRYVVDTGRSKQKTVKSVDSGLTQFEVAWVSKSSATQRAGRAGRTGPGHCYRLFSSAFFNDNFPQYSVPDIRNTPLEAVVLQLKSIGVDKPESFPFPTQPNPSSLSKAEKCLRILDVVDPKSGQINSLGSFLSKFPVNPRHARMLVASVMHCGTPKLLGKCLQTAISVAAILSFENFIAQEKSDPLPDASKGNKESSESVECLSKDYLRTVVERYGGDVFASLEVLRAYEEEAATNSYNLRAFCQRNGLHPTIIRDVLQLKRQLASICATRVDSSEGSNLKEHEIMKKAVSEAGGRLGLQAVTPRVKTQLSMVIRRALCVGWQDKIAKRAQGRRNYMYGKTLVRSKRSSKSPFVVFRDLIQTKKAVYMEMVTEVKEGWLSDDALADAFDDNHDVV
ncbi:P-loop-containing nucleoside triphosphate hydrolase [Chloropicon primus]|uniref:RNA helicase n=1 Tax=Chloropicon primus TaxID=1764295 RepID=A0A5B8MNM1_9CHLO|nr:P-loop-containing nucleoside triphosphate hydrolase [Chloropicon primus]UPR00359.1 P-loop-containing nucleoside triphosphate hydrolase [Chloropicon primus]|eukprot:QDZ21145.1 P-loop-containing nucleoside triphosphate hydrolase [Chloropicon primus]